MKDYDVIIIGAGVSGCAIARELAKGKLRIAVLEAKSDVCEGTSKANSGIVHAGYDAVPGTLKAQLNVRGNEMMEELSKKLDFPFRRNGSLVLCFEEDAMSGLEELYQRGMENGVKELKLLSPEEVWGMEPAVSRDIVGALYAPTGGIVCPFGLNIALAENAAENGVEFYRNHKVTSIVEQRPVWSENPPEKEGRMYQVQADGEMFLAPIVINAAGVYADEIHNMICEDRIRIVPRRGEYRLMDKNCGNLVNSTVFQLPSKMGKGILVTPTVHGNLLVGPTAEDIPDKEDVDTTAEGLTKVLNLGSNSVDALDGRQTITSFAGLRAHLVHEEPAEKSDFLIGEAEGHPGFIDVAGIESPGLTSAPAIGEYVARIVKNIYPAERKTDFIDSRKGIPSMALATEEEREALIRENPAFANVICRCELVTEGEILEAIHRSVGATTLDGVKRRTRAGMGRCQAGFCSPKTLEILSRELHLDPAQITKEGTGSEILTGKNKDTAPGEGGTWKRTQAPVGKEALHE
jgi:FAD dependent oxidoreductase